MSRRANPANLTWNSATKNDSVFDMFNKIVTTGNAANGVSWRLHGGVLGADETLIESAHSLPLPI
jgi:hypothetical protein